MDSTILSLLGAFLLSLIGLFAFIWSLRQGLLVENPRAAAVIFAPGEIGRIDEPALPPQERAAMQDAVTPRGDPVQAADLTEIADRVAADHSSAFPTFMFLAFACFWLLIGSVAGSRSTTSCRRSSGGRCARTTCRCWASGRSRSSTDRSAATT